MSIFTLTTAPSGCFDLRHDSSALRISESSSLVFNPGVLEPHKETFELKQQPLVLNDWVNACKDDGTWRIEQSAIDCYAETAVDLAVAMAKQSVECRLAPLRGASRPAMLVEVMTRGALQFEFFDFKQGSSGKRDAEIKKSLTAILKRTDPETQLRTIQIVDTAIGGYGINSLVKFLAEIRLNNFGNQSWVIDCHLLHPTNGRQNVGNIDGAQNHSSDGFQVVVTRYPVADLIVEDFDDALAFTLEMENGLYIGKPSVVPGQFLLRQDNACYSVDSEDLMKTFDQIFSQAVTDSLLADPDRELTKVVWQEYQEKS